MDNLIEFAVDWDRRFVDFVVDQFIDLLHDILIETLIDWRTE